jgi:hypothetical protein
MKSTVENSDIDGCNARHRVLNISIHTVLLVIWCKVIDPVIVLTPILAWEMFNKELFQVCYFLLQKQKKVEAAYLRKTE